MEKAKEPEKWEDFQTVKMPPEAPTEGRNSKASN